MNGAPWSDGKEPHAEGEGGLEREDRGDDLGRSPLEIAIDTGSVADVVEVAMRFGGIDGHCAFSGISLLAKCLLNRRYDAAVAMIMLGASLEVPDADGPETPLNYANEYAVPSQLLLAIAKLRDAGWLKLQNPMGEQ